MMLWTMDLLKTESDETHALFLVKEHVEFMKEPTADKQLYQAISVFRCGNKEIR